MTLASAPEHKDTTPQARTAGLDIAHPHRVDYDVRCFLCQHLMRAPNAHYHYTTAQHGTNPVCLSCGRAMVAEVI
jgi:hypothetical protein